jgi:hypothetical protein
MKYQEIIGVILLVLIIMLWILLFRKQKSSIRLLPYQFKYIGYLILLAIIITLFYTNNDYTSLLFYFGSFGGLVIALSQEIREYEIDYEMIRKKALYSTLRNILPIITILGIINIILYNNESYVKDITLSTPSTLFLLIIGYLIEFQYKKKKAKNI